MRCMEGENAKQKNVNTGVNARHSNAWYMETVHYCGQNNNCLMVLFNP